MGFFDSFSGWLPALAANPVMLGANALAGGLDFWASEKDRAADSDRQRAQDDWASTEMAWAREQFGLNRDLQREFAQNGIRWRVADAEAAGLHPLAALGAQGSAYSPSTTAFNGPQYNPTSRGGDSLRALSNMGQNLARAASASSTAFERQQQALSLKNQALQNDLLETQIANSKYELMSRSVGPSMPSTIQYMRNADGSISKQPSPEFQAAVGGNILGNTAWQIENKLIPYGASILAPSHNAVDMNGQSYQYKWGRYVPSSDWGGMPDRYFENRGFKRR